MHIKQWLCAAALIGTWAYGCGDDGSGGVSGSKKISDLSANERKQVCDALQTKFTRVDTATTKLTCTITGFTLSDGDAASCNTQRSSCIADAAKTPDSSTDLKCDTNAGDLQDCGDVTVGDLNDCADTLVSSVEAQANKLSCSSSTTDLQTAGNITTPASCTKIDTACPMLAGDDSAAP